MSSRRTTEPSVFFPWEQRRGVIGALGRRRARGVVLAVVSIVAIVAVYENGERSASVRTTRASLTTVGRALSAYRADHQEACPRALGDLVAMGYLRSEPVDAWGRPLRLECPGRRDPLGFDLSSDGPDGVPGGLDRVQ
jgi:general secretion pathway protein G